MGNNLNLKLESLASNWNILLCVLLSNIPEPHRFSRFSSSLSCTNENLITPLFKILHNLKSNFEMLIGVQINMSSIVKEVWENSIRKS